MSTPPTIRSRQIGGWNLGARDTRRLYRVTIHTSIEDWDEYVLARSREEVDLWITMQHPGGWTKGYEPTVLRLDSGLDSIHLIE